MKRIILIFTICLISIISHAAEIVIKNSKNEIIGKVKLSAGTTYNVYDTKGKKLCSYKASAKLTAANMKNKKFKLIKTQTGYIIK